MKNTKNQTPKTNKVSSTKYSRSHEGNGDPSAAWVLKDEPVKGGKERHPFDFEERTAVFGENIVRFAKRIRRSPVNDRLINQIVGAGTSIGANFCEANDCVSKKRFSKQRQALHQRSKGDTILFTNDRCLGRLFH